MIELKRCAHRPMRGPETDLNLYYSTVHWRQTQSLLRSNRAGVRWLSHQLWTHREESPGQSKVGAKTSLDQLFVQYKCTVMYDINGHYLQGFPLYEAHQIGRATTGEPTPLELGRFGDWRSCSSIVNKTVHVKQCSAAAMTETFTTFTQPSSF